MSIAIAVAAWIAMAFTCGPHHRIHGVHIAFEGRSGGMLDLIAVVVGLPAGVVWFLLRIEAFAGGQGDRFVPGTPFWLLALPTVAGMYVTALVAASIGLLGPGLGPAWNMVVPNILLLGIYMTISYYLLRTQLGNRSPLGGWSVSGLSLCVHPSRAGNGIAGAVEGAKSALLVDDNADVRFLARCLLEGAGFEISEAESGREALGMLTGRLPDIVLLDVQMPEMDGWETLQVIRDDPATSDLPVVLWTVKGRLEDILRGWELGCDGYLPKPFDARQLEDEVRRVTSQGEDERAQVRVARLADARAELASAG